MSTNLINAQTSRWKCVFFVCIFHIDFRVIDAFLAKRSLNKESYQIQFKHRTDTKEATSQVIGLGTTCGIIDSHRISQISRKPLSLSVYRVWVCQRRRKPDKLLGRTAYVMRRARWIWRFESGSWWSAAWTFSRIALGIDLIGHLLEYFMPVFGLKVKMFINESWRWSVCVCFGD